MMAKSNKAKHSVRKCLSKAFQKATTNLCLVHFDEPRVDLGPHLDPTNVPQLVRVLMEWSSLHLYGCIFMK